MHYPAFIEIDTDGSASGWFPDVDGCIFAGDSIEETIADAQSALDAHFEALVANDMDIPAPGKMQDHIANKEAEFTHGQWVLVHVNMDKFDGRAERINITLPHRLLNQIDNAVKGHTEYTSRSGFLAAAARHELHKVS
ncbi:type II toxin-antitoxin system HicB family antitoxin [Scandinavium goeteborgense]|uniref:type II toxin-antitoxin system HicB family antitoxin n=1 Tax=Scandinavium goeteborgense TaxID=1851514 RepID=UPI000F6794A1|nr:type II toxin-antitoxin system HicB family antitoxin [Scandinavium goeteborgense]QKN80779.1 type II toxin-antitoxin system HicB family antitoxin [Scandinavium goeteborgense]